MFKIGVYLNMFQEKLIEKIILINLIKDIKKQLWK